MVVSKGVLFANGTKGLRSSTLIDLWGNTKRAAKKEESATVARKVVKQLLLRNVTGMMSDLWC